MSAQRVAADLKFEDRMGHAREAYAVGHRIVVVRPDGIVGAIVHGEDGLKRYFGGIFDALTI